MCAERERLYEAERKREEFVKNEENFLRDGDLM